MRKVLVTGASGFIGRYSLPLLSTKGYEIHALARRGLAPDDLEGVLWHNIDLLEPGAPSELLSRVQPEYLLHLAWYAVPGRFWEALENVEWVRASLELFSGFAKFGGKRLVSAATCAEYDWSFGECKEGTTPLLPPTLYGTSKHALERILHCWERHGGFSSAWGRIFFLYGPGEHPSRLVAYVVRSLIQGQPALCSDGKQIRDFLYVEDVASAFIALLESDVTGPVNIGSGKPVAVRDMLGEIGRYMERQELIRLGEREPTDEPGELWANIDRLTKEVGWAPSYDLVRGLERTVDWWRALGRL